MYTVRKREVIYHKLEIDEEEALNLAHNVISSMYDLKGRFLGDWFGEPMILEWAESYHGSDYKRQVRKPTQKDLEGLAVLEEINEKLNEIRKSNDLR